MEQEDWIWRSRKKSEELQLTYPAKVACRVASRGIAAGYGALGKQGVGKGSLEGKCNPSEPLKKGSTGKGGWSR